MKRVELFEVIRKEHRDQDLSIRELARRHKVHRRDIRAALESPIPPTPKKRQRRSPKLGPYMALIRTWLVEDQTAPPKQRHTARRIWCRLVDEHGADLGEGTVRNFVAEVHKELALDLSDVAIAQQHDLGDEAEVDFGEFYVWLGGAWTKLHMFVMRLSASGKAFHCAFVACDQVAFLEGHIRAFEHFGGVPRRIRYDNLKAAVVSVLLGRERLENETFIAFRSHYGFESFYCIPGVKGAHEKGGVEGDIGRFRRNHLVPVPHVESIRELNSIISGADFRDDNRHIGARKTTVGADFATERAHLMALPFDSFDTMSTKQARVDSKARVCVKRNFYSVPVRYARRLLDVRIGTDEVIISDGATEVARHNLATTKGAEVYELDHYLETLQRKPGALAGSTALAQARRNGTFTQTHDEFWQTARRRLGDAKGTKALIEVLLLHRELDNEVVISGIKAALQVASIDPVIVAIEARRVRGPQSSNIVAIESASRFDRPAPEINSYNELLEVTK